MASMSEDLKVVYDGICGDLIQRGWVFNSGPISFWENKSIPRADIKLKPEHHVIRIEGVHRLRSDAKTQYWDEVATLEDGLTVTRMITKRLTMEEEKDARIR